jgi:anti-sigma regulatory factor (Ser/Thr protein kinase)
MPLYLHRVTPLVEWMSYYRKHRTTEVRRRKATVTAFADIPQARSGTRLFPGRTKHIAAVRSYLAEILDGCPVAEDAILCGSELAANAAIHSRSSQPGGHFAVRAEIRPGEYVQIEVADQGGPWTGSGDAGDRAHGLDIVRALAGNGNWGIKGTASGRVAWARLDWAATEERNGADPGCTEPT